MEKTVQGIKFAGALLAAMITYLFGGMDAVFQILLCFLAIDYITGVMAAIYLKSLSSEVGFRGIMKKAAILFVVAVGHLAGQVTGFAAARSLVIGFYIANEGLSILENVGKMGARYPEKLLELLTQLCEKKQ